MPKRRRNRKIYTQYKAIERMLVQAAIVVIASAGGSDAYGGSDTYPSRLGDDRGEETTIDSREGEESWRIRNTGGLLPWTSLPIATMLATDQSRRINDVLASAVGESLADMTALERSSSVCSLATSEEVELRVVAALALQSPLPILGALWSIEHLARDPDPVVRRVVVQAASRRRSESPEQFRGVLRRLRADSDPGVARAARDVARLPEDGLGFDRV